ncbi:MAG: pseudouridine synthase [Planctomycetota bacterium]
MDSRRPSRPSRKLAKNRPAPPQPAAPGLVRINKFLAGQGFSSRRGSEEMILSGAVSVNGEIITKLGTKVDPAVDRIEVNGKSIITNKTKVVYALNKPLGVVCTNAPEESRPRAIDLVRDPKGARLFCVGRLDMDSEGLVLLTNDGEFTNRVTHPRYGIGKSYYVKIRGEITADALQKIQKGVWLAEGRTQGARVYVRKRMKSSTVLMVTVREGMNREIRRIFAKLGFVVQRLKRVAIGPVSVKGIGSGHYRKLTNDEIHKLLRTSKSGEPASPAGPIVDSAAGEAEEGDDDGMDN